MGRFELPAPHAGAIPGYATSRYDQILPIQKYLKLSTAENGRMVAADATKV